MTAGPRARRVTTTAPRRRARAFGPEFIPQRSRPAPAHGGVSELISAVRSPKVTEQPRTNQLNGPGDQWSPAGTASRRLSGSGERRREVLVDSSQELLGGQPGLVRADQKRQVLGHQI